LNFRRFFSSIVIHCTVWDEVVNPLTPRKYTVLNGNFVFDGHDVFLKCNPGIKLNLPVIDGICP
jgi:hypothetical protein